MTPDEITNIVQGIPHTTPSHGLELYNHVLKSRARRCMELGFAHGVGAVWIGGAISKLGGGELVSVDVSAAHERVPSASTLLAKAGLEQIVTLHFDPVSYTWHLMRKLEEYESDKFDFIFIDGAHTWDTDGFAFYLCTRILKPGGWILFDDLDWSYSSSPSMRDSEFVQGLPSEQREMRQVRAVWEKLVLTDPRFGNFVEDGGWGWAQKTSEDSARTLSVRKTMRVPSLRSSLRRLLR